MLERKYGGVKARNAALTIQRAFRHYTLLKKFAAITAMAKAEKRLSRRMVGFPEISSENHSHHLELDRYLPPGPPSMPLRSMSMRERRSGSGDSVPLSSPTPGTVLPRSHSGRCDLNYYCDNSHTLYYPQQDSYIETSKVCHLKTESNLNFCLIDIIYLCVKQLCLRYTAYKFS